MRCFSCAVFSALTLLTICRAQETSDDKEPMITFGTTVVRSSGFRGDIYFLKEGTQKLPKFEKLEALGHIYTNRLFILPREFQEGFPGVTNRFEWFAIDYNCRFWIEKPGVYRFGLASDDGSKLYIDGRTVINLDGVHGPEGQQRSVKLTGGIHQMRVSYFQGPRFHVALILEVAPPGEDFRAFNTDRFIPPSNPDEWKYGEKDQLTVPPDPNAGRRRLGDPKKK